MYTNMYTSIIQLHDVVAVTWFCVLQYGKHARSVNTQTYTPA